MTPHISPEPLSTSTADSTWPRLELRLLGQPAFLVDGAPRPLRFARRRSVHVLTLCALQGGAGISRAALAAHLWPDVPDAEARGNLRRHLSGIAEFFSALRQPLDLDSATVRWNARSEIVVDFL